MLDETSIARSWRATKTRSSPAWTCVSLGGEMVTLPLSLRYNGHPSGPFNQDVSNSRSTCGAPTFSVATSEPCGACRCVLKYYTDSAGVLAKFRWPRAAPIAYFLPSQTRWGPESSRTSTVLKVDSSKAASGRRRCVTSASDPPGSRWSGAPRTRRSSTPPVCLFPS